MRRREQLLRARPAPGGFGTRGPAHRDRGEAPARSLDRAVSPKKVALPNRLCGARCCHGPRTGEKRFNVLRVLRRYRDPDAGRHLERGGFLALGPGASVATSLPDLPRFLVLEPVSTVRLEIHLAAPSCEIDVELENPAAGRSFVLLIGHKDGPYVQRVRLAGRARIHFDPESPGDYVLLLANPNRQPLVLRIRARDLPLRPKVRVPARRKPSGRRSRAPTGSRAPHPPRAARRRRTASAAGLASDSVTHTKS